MSQTRQLAAIMFTDIVGYTSLMGDDEHKAFELLTINRDNTKARHRTIQWTMDKRTWRWYNVKL